MNMGWVLGIAGGFLALAMMVPGLLLAWTLLLPAFVLRARGRIATMPWRCGFTGVAVLVPASLFLVVLFNLPGGLGQVAGWVGVGVGLAAMSLGGAALATLMSERMQPVHGPTPGGLVRAAVALELALIAPIIGWFVLLPLVAILTLGATTLAFLRPAAQRRLVTLTEAAHEPEPS
jgi:hypothetical protein